MVPSKIHLEVVTPERRVFEREVDEVILPGAVGMFGVLPGHAPLLSELQAGVATCRGPFGREVMAISAGFAEVTGDRVTVMAETCERAEEIDLARAEEKVEELEEEIGRPGVDVGVVRVRLMKHLARVQARKSLGG